MCCLFFPILVGSLPVHSIITILCFVTCNSGRKTAIIVFHCTADFCRLRNLHFTEVCCAVCCWTVMITMMPLSAAPLVDQVYVEDLDWQLIPNQIAVNDLVTMKLCTRSYIWLTLDWVFAVNVQSRDSCHVSLIVTVVSYRAIPEHNWGLKWAIQLLSELLVIQDQHMHHVFSLPIHPAKKRMQRIRLMACSLHKIRLYDGVFTVHRLSIFHAQHVRKTDWLTYLSAGGQNWQLGSN